MGFHDVTIYVIVVVVVLEMGFHDVMLLSS